MKIATIVPARKGSKGIKNKNKKILGNMPLVEWTFQFASSLKNSFINIVSTDDQDILTLSQKYNFINFGLRPINLSQDNSLTIDVLKYEVNNLLKIYKDIDGVMLLQPTCPFRNKSLFENTIEEFSRNSSISFVSVSDVGGNHPQRMKIITNGFLENYIEQGFEDMRPRQLLPKIYIRSGSLYLTSINNILSGKLVGEKQKPVILENLYTINIDDLKDFMLAEIFLPDFINLNSF